jgi:hypothetical protein
VRPESGVVVGDDLGGLDLEAELGEFVGDRGEVSRVGGDALDVEGVARVSRPATSR